MLQQHRRKSGFAAAFYFSELLYHSVVRTVRKSSRNALVGLAINIFQSAMMVAIFYFMFAILGMRGMAVRGDFLLYLMTGVFLYMGHIKAVTAVIKSEGPASAMMKHAPMTTVLSIASSAIAALYTQILSMTVILFVVHVAIRPIEIYKPVALIAPVLLAWFSGVVVGLLFLGLQPWFPKFVSVASQIYIRANMVASGKMFLANSLPTYMLPFFTWNPLFHSIDQARGAAFINYNPHYSSISYPLYFCLAALTIGMMGEFWARKNASVSTTSAQ